METQLQKGGQNKHQSFMELFYNYCLHDFFCFMSKEIRVGKDFHICLE